MMETVVIRYGSESVRMRFDTDRFQVLETPAHPPALTDIEIGERLDDPVGSPPIEEIVTPGETVLFVVPDATRSSACGQMINLIVRRLIANGTMPHEMAAIFATGIHRPVTDDEKREILTPFLAQRLKTLDHAPRDLMRLRAFGTTSGGIPVSLNNSLTEFDHVIAIGSVNFHYFAGFTGGRKLICPGLAASKTISSTHKLAFDCVSHDRTIGVGPGLLDGNPVHESFVEAAAKIKISFAVNSLVGDSGAAYEMFCGDIFESHRVACEAFAGGATLQIQQKRPLVIASCGGDPYDLNMIQAHKSLEAAAAACSDGGTIVLAAECRDGAGSSDLLDWFDAANSRQLAERLCERYKVNGQTAWSILKKAERYQIKMATSLGREDLAKMRIEKISIAEMEKAGDPSATGYVIPNASKLRILCDAV